jgi:hypothetical protein
MEAVSISKPKRKTFFDGVFRAFDLFGVTRSEGYQEALDNLKKHAIDDQEALRKDWVVVGNHIRSAIVLYGETHHIPLEREKKKNDR